MNPNSANYPFDSHYYESAEGKMHYVDQGSGPVLLFVHGTPAWSFTYRHLIKTLSENYRCIAPDHLGFGKSDKPADADYAPQAHARRLGQFMAHLHYRTLT
jgi:haloalkane dehalogenase